ncbi:TetR/AcrR family transcriptional regulator [Paractinoplanes lichenicola]|uniref:TetR/AcrR family transcriptional regulator n=1 Tax=Paractinoplanes lichenicola TaxID=2802976 RepID=A0ABS1VZJ9_9ACTN|nr:TetR/AcrR family transcriptional regulator [Actinoplanes lichenicola]MBL7259910.1 TetR/AcrR family transcriptional regulator [Actinoplanes lichenicola]
MRKDAQRNIERLREAAVSAFREHGLEVPLEQIAQRAGVSPGTVYNRFGGRDALIDAVMPELIEARIQEMMERALAVPDPWDGFAAYVTSLCEMQATDPALNDAVSRRFPDAARLTEICDAQMGRARGLIDRAQAAGSLRADFAVQDMAFLLWSTAAIVRATAGIAPLAWRRSLALALDGLRPGAAHPLPVAAMTDEQVKLAMIGLGPRRAR